MFRHNFKNIPCYETSEVSLKGFILELLYLQWYWWTYLKKNTEIGVYRLFKSFIWNLYGIYGIYYMRST